MSTLSGGGKRLWCLRRSLTDTPVGKSNEFSLQYIEQTLSAQLNNREWLAWTN